MTTAPAPTWPRSMTEDEREIPCQHCWHQTDWRLILKDGAVIGRTFIPGFGPGPADMETQRESRCCWCGQTSTLTNQHGPWLKQIFSEQRP